MSVTYYEIDEKAARFAREANSHSSYKPGSATDEYRASVNVALAKAVRRKSAVPVEHHAEIDGLVDAYARKLAAWMNKGFGIEGRCPSVLVAGPANFNSRRKEKQNQARGAHWKEADKLTALLARIDTVGAERCTREHRHEVRAEGWSFDGGRVVMNAEANRLQLVFDGKPDEGTRVALKSRGFRWSPRFGAWQRQLTDNAVQAARDVLQERGDR